jgi:glutamine amidotransferase
MKVGVIDYGAGNFQSVVRALRSLGVEPHSITRAADFNGKGFSHIIFPGVGRASQAMDALRTRGLDAVIRRHVEKGLPLLGICVGMQVLGRYSEEDDTACLGLLDFELKRFVCAEPVPHMGWNLVRFLGAHPLVGGGPFAPFAALHAEGDQSAEPDPGGSGLQSEAHFYFVHSFAALMDEKTEPPARLIAPECVVGTTRYGSVSFASIVGLGNVLGVQFHVEKSGRAGQQFLLSFLKMEA